MTGGQLNANVEQYLQAAAANVPPPPITSDPLVAGVTPIEQLLRVLGLAANLGDPQDQADATEEYAKRDAKTIEAAERFAEQDEQASAEMSGVAAQDASAQMAQQLPQMASGIAGALSGALGGALQPFSQIPQQIAQGAQQAMQTGMGLFQQAGGGAAGGLEDADLTAAPWEADLGYAPGDFDDLGSLGAGAGGGGGGLGEDAGFGAGSGGGFGGTTPTAMLGPPAIPSASTSPSSAPALPTPPPVATPVASTGGAGMAGMPMVPPGAMGGAASADSNAKPDTKRVSAPSVRNGAPVQGRLTAPPGVPVVTTKVDGQAVATKRIVLPHSRNEDDQTSEGKPSS